MDKIFKLAILLFAVNSHADQLSVNSSSTLVIDGSGIETTHVIDGSGALSFQVIDGSGIRAVLANSPLVIDGSGIATVSVPFDIDGSGLHVIDGSGVGINSSGIKPKVIDGSGIASRIADQTEIRRQQLHSAASSNRLAIDTYRQEMILDNLKKNSMVESGLKEGLISSESAETISLQENISLRRQISKESRSQIN